MKPEHILQETKMSDNMVGKTVYKAKIKSGSIVIEPYTITGELPRSKKWCWHDGGCYKTDIGLVIFLTKKEAMTYLLEKLEHDRELGENYLKKTELLIEEAKKEVDKL